MVDSLSEGCKWPLVIADWAPFERGWVFFYTSRRYIETRRFEFAPGGNGPIVIDLVSDEVHLLPTHTPSETLLRRYVDSCRGSQRDQA